VEMLTPRRQRLNRGRPCSNGHSSFSWSGPGGTWPDGSRGIEVAGRGLNVHHEVDCRDVRDQETKMASGIPEYQPYPETVSRADVSLAEGTIQVRGQREAISHESRISF